MRREDLAIPDTDATTLTATTAGTSRIVLPTGNRRGPLLVWNNTASLAQIKVGDNTVTATADSFPIPAGELQAINPGDTATHITAYCASGTVALKVFSLGGV